MRGTGPPPLRGGQHGTWITALCDPCAADARTHAAPEPEPEAVGGDREMPFSA